LSGVGPTVVYSLCLLTSIVCAALLMRSWLATRTRLLLFSSLCFALLAVNNLFLVADMVWFPAQDLRLWRQLCVLAALGVLLYAFIWEVQ
jgi:hypothetical protein